MPRSAEGAEPDQLMTLQVCAEALEDAGYAPNRASRGYVGESLIGRIARSL